MECCKDIHFETQSRPVEYTVLNLWPLHLWTNTLTDWVEEAVAVHELECEILSLKVPPVCIPYSHPGSIPSQRPWSCIFRNWTGSDTLSNTLSEFSTYLLEYFIFNNYTYPDYNSPANYYLYIYTKLTPIFTAPASCTGSSVG